MPRGLPARLLFAAAALTVPAACHAGLTAGFHWPDMPATFSLVLLAVLWVAAIATACTAVILRYLADYLDYRLENRRSTLAELTAEMDRRISRED
jgi:hypothetical protein